MKTSAAILIVAILFVAGAAEAVQWYPLGQPFAGAEWEVKVSDTPVGPGANRFSDDPAVVHVDEDGRLHLAIHQVDGYWRAAEIRSVTPTHFGIHAFRVVGPVDSLDARAVFALFLYQDDLTELDMELTWWGDPACCRNGQFAVQPAAGSCEPTGNLEPFVFSLEGGYTTHFIEWGDGYARFRSAHGHQTGFWDGVEIHQRFFTDEQTGGIPGADAQMRVHLNLWLYDTTGPPNQPYDEGAPLEVIVADVGLPVGTAVPQQWGTPRVQAWPNPFRASTRIGFALENLSPVYLDVYDVSGRRVRSLLKGSTREAGEGIVNWDGRDNAGRQLPSGVYLCRLRTAGQATTRRLLLLR